MAEVTLNLVVPFPLFFASGSASLPESPWALLVSIHMAKLVGGETIRCLSLPCLLGRAEAVLGELRTISDVRTKVDKGT